jgi:hypothetical protein
MQLSIRLQAVAARKALAIRHPPMAKNANDMIRNRIDAKLTIRAKA